MKNLSFKKCQFYFEPLCTLFNLRKDVISESVFKCTLPVVSKTCTCGEIQYVIFVLFMVTHLKHTVTGRCHIQRYHGHSHNALLPMGYFVQMVIWIITDKTYRNFKIGTSFKVSFITDNPHDNLYKISHWKQCIMGRPQYLLWVTFISHSGIKYRAIYVQEVKYRYPVGLYP